MNKLILIGNVTKDPEKRATQNGNSVCSFTLAVNRRFAGPDGNKITDFFRINAWRQLADVCGRYHTIPSEAGDYELFARRAETLSERRDARKESQEMRVLEAKKLVEESDEQWLVWCDYNSESEALHKAIDGSVEVVGADSPDFKSYQAILFVDGKTKCLVSKSSIYGMGLNFQNCHNIIYCGISDSFESFYQSVRRCWRYGQQHEVNAHIIISEKEMNVLDNIKRKEAQMNEMQSNMISLMHDVTMSEIKHTTRITTEYNPKERMALPTWIA